MASGIKVVMGGAGPPLQKRDDDSTTKISQFADLLKKYDIDTIDSAIIYGDSEVLIGGNKLGDKFIIDTKLPGGINPGRSAHETVVKDGNESLDRLKIKQINILYLHSPDTTVPFESTLKGIDELHKNRVFKRFGLSNFTPDQVKEVYDICKKNNYVLPTAYQGNYNAFARSYETTLLPLLHSLSISFYAYSPQAGGFLAKTSDLVTSGTGRFDPSNGFVADMYKALYAKPTLLQGLTKWNEIAVEAGIRPGDMAIRWVRFNSALKREYGDALIVGAGRSLETGEQTLKAIGQGPLPDEVAGKIDGVWEMVKDEAPVDNYHDVIKSGIAARPK